LTTGSIASRSPEVVVLAARAVKLFDILMVTAIFTALT
jgi:hypothetical protein